MNDDYVPRHVKEYFDKEEVNDKYYNVDMNEEVDYDLLEDKKTEVVVRKKRTLKKWVWSFFIFIFIVIIAVCVMKIISWVSDNKTTSSITEEINNIVVVNEKEDDDKTEIVNEVEDKTSDYWYFVSFPLIDVDFTKLKEKNNDTVGWISVNNTNINYPYVQGKDNSYYLNHSFDKSYNEAGWVFLDYRNDSSLSDRNNILYAHSRLDKTMFGSLSKTLKSNWYSNRDNHIIRLSSEEENTMWQIFSVYKIPEESYYITTVFNSDDEYMSFLNTIKDRSIYNFNTDLNSGDKILTLSTCYSDTERTVVHAKLIKKSVR